MICISMSFKQKHSDATKQKISRAMKGKKHPRFGAEWTDEQRVKFQLTVYNRKLQEQLLKNFILQHNAAWEQFQINNK